MNVDTLPAAGLDILHRFDARAIAHELALPMLATHPVGILVGNTRALWPHFVAAREPVADPLEHYVERAIDALGLPCFYAHRRYDGAFLPFQRVAVAAGLGTLSATGLVIHPSFGPWFALRAIVLADGDPPPRVAISPPCTCEAPCLTALATAVSHRDWHLWLAVRDACPVGRSWRYDDAQIVYHYTRALKLML